MSIPIIGSPFSLATATLVQSVVCNCGKAPAPLTCVAQSDGGGWSGAPAVCQGCGRIYTIAEVHPNKQGGVELGMNVQQALPLSPEPALVS